MGGTSNMIIKYISLFVFTVMLLYSFYKADPNIKAGILGLFGAVFIAVYTHIETKNREIKARHFLEKRESYSHLINLLFEIFKATKEGNEINKEELESGMMNFKKSLIIWGSPDVIEAWNQYEENGAKGLGATEVLKGMENILRTIRRDLGHNDDTLDFGSLVGLILVAEDKGQIIVNN